MNELNCYLFNYLDWNIIIISEKEIACLNIIKKVFKKHFFKSTINYRGIINFFSVFQNLKTFLQRFLSR